MAKSRKKGNNNIKIGNNNSSREVKKILTMTLIVLAFFGLFYLLTLWILDKDISLSNSKNEKNGEVEIQNEELLVGTSFSVSDEEYLVLYYDVLLDKEDSTLSTLVTQYQSSNKDLSLYTVDLSNALNKRFVTDKDGNSSAVNASELKLKNPTLIKFVDGKISEYIDNQEDIVAYLK